MRIKKALKYILFLFLVIGIGLLQSFSKSRNGRKMIAKISVKFDGEKGDFLDQEMVNKLLIQNGESLTNQAKSELDLHNLECKVIENPYVDRASVHLTLEGQLETRIVEKEPIARILSQSGSFYIDSKGVKLPWSDHYTPRVILVSGAERSERIEKITPLLVDIYKDEFLRKELIGVRMLPNEELEFEVRSADHSIVFGKLNQVGIKFNKLKAFYHKVFKDKTMEAYKTINLKYHNQVVCTK